MIIRKADPTDFEAMAQIWLEGSRAGHPFLGETVLEEQLSTVRDVYFPQADNWVAQEGPVIGFIGLLGIHIGGLFVSPAAHRRGVGRRLVEHAADRLGCLTVEVYEQNKGAVGFYLSCSFVPAGRKATDDEGRPFPLLRLTRSRRSEQMHPMLQSEVSDHTLATEAK
jgi:putative acetyltransferase